LGGGRGGVGGASASFRRSAARRNQASSSSNISGGESTGAESNSGNVLWLGCCANTHEQICAAMKKIGCDVAPPPSHRTKASAFPMAMAGAGGGNAMDMDIKESSNKPSRFQIINIMTDMEQTMMNDTETSDEEPPTAKYSHEEFYESFLKNIYKQIKEWKKSHMGSMNRANPKSCLVLLDNVSQLANFFGPRLVYSFILQVRSLLQQEQPIDGSSTTTNPFSLIVSCSHDMDQEYYLAATNQEQSNQSVTGAKQAQYIGAGGRGVLLSSPAELALLEQRANYELLGGDSRGGESMDVPVWERALVELADGIIDVTPLPSGFARDVMGRLVFTERKGGLGWKGGKDHEDKIRRNNGSLHGGSGGGSIGNVKFSSQIVNYSCWEGGVKAIRLRA
jgi:hypothetical protein